MEHTGMTSEESSKDLIEILIERGLADIELGRFQLFTPSYAEDMATKFKARLYSGLYDDVER